MAVSVSSRYGYLSIQICYLAAKEGRTEVLLWLQCQCPQISRWFHLASLTAAKHSQLETVQWLRRQDPVSPWSDDICTAAAHVGQH